MHPTKLRIEQNIIYLLFLFKARITDSVVSLKYQYLNINNDNNLVILNSGHLISCNEKLYYSAIND